MHRAVTALSPIFSCTDESIVSSLFPVQYSENDLHFAGEPRLLALRRRMLKVSEQRHKIGICCLLKFIFRQCANMIYGKFRETP